MRFSVVVPTFRRRELVLRNVAALAAQTETHFEVIVVDDGSRDGTPEALRELETPFPLTVIEQENLGAGAARNAGAAAARGELLLFLDDDMEADPRLLAEHDRTRREGADVVLGDLPLHPDSPRNLLSWGVGLWARTRRERLCESGAEVGLGDLLTGQLSISREEFERLGGFDQSFTRDGLFGGEDVDFCYRVMQDGLRIVFNPDAISRQYYDVDPAVYLLRAREAGRSGQELAIKYPEPPGRFGRIQGFHRRRDRWIFQPFIYLPAWVAAPLRTGVAALARTGHTGERLRRLFFNVRTMERLRGARIARRASSMGRAVVVAYHSISDLSGDPVLGPYGVTPGTFCDQLDSLAEHGWTFVDLDAVLAAIAGESVLPPRAVLVTFDDSYADLLGAALQLRERGVPAVAFAVSDLTGQTNEWDQEIGAAAVPLLDGDGLRSLPAHGVEVGSHGASHRSLVGLAPGDLAFEVEESATRLAALGLPAPRAFSYPYGESDPAARQAVKAAGYRAAFTVKPGVVERGADRTALPRVQVNAGDGPRRLRLKLRTASWPSPCREGILRVTRSLL